jgi:hypothetical protein
VSELICLQKLGEFGSFSTGWESTGNDLSATSTFLSFPATFGFIVDSGFLSSKYAENYGIDG